MGTEVGDESEGNAGGTENDNEDSDGHNNSTKNIPTPPIETYLQVIHPKKKKKKQTRNTTDDSMDDKTNDTATETDDMEEGVLRLTSIDLHTSVTLTQVHEIFNYSTDYLGLLKAGIVASGIVPPSFETMKESNESNMSFGDLFAVLLGDRTKGLHLITNVKNIPKGSRLAVSTNLLASIITVCMRATGQTTTTPTSTTTTTQSTAFSTVNGNIHKSSSNGGNGTNNNNNNDNDNDNNDNDNDNDQLLVPLPLHVGPLVSNEDRRKAQARAILGEWLGGSGGGWQGTSLKISMFKVQYIRSSKQKRNTWTCLYTV